MILEIILGIIIVVLLYAIINLIKKITKYQKLFIEYDNKIEYMVDQFTVTIDKLNEVDKRGAFKSDDEVGFVWEELKTIINSLKEDIYSSLPEMYYEEQGE